MTIQGQNPVTSPTAQTSQGSPTATTPATDPTAALANEKTSCNCWWLRSRIRILDESHRFGSVPQPTGAIQSAGAVDWNPAGTATRRVDDGDHNSDYRHHWYDRNNDIHRQITWRTNYQKREIEICVFFNSTFRAGREQHGLGRSRQ